MSMNFISQSSKTIGDFISFEWHEGALLGKTSNGLFKVEVFTSAVIKVSVALHQNTFDDFSYAVIAKPEQSAFKPVENSDSIVLSTSAIQVVINKNPVHFSFRNLQGDVLNEDGPFLRTSWH